MTHCWFPPFSQGILAKALNDDFGKSATMTENANRYPEPHEGTVHVVRKAGMRIKAISCELSAAS